MSGLRLLAALAALLCTAAAASAQTWPTRPVRIIVGFTPASSNDLLARFVGGKLAERIGQQVVVDNRPGANGIIGADLTAKATPDGHTLMLVSTSHTMNAAVNKLPFDPVKAFAPVATIGSGPLVLVAHPSFAANNVKELIARAAAKPNAITYGSAGNGGINHFGGALFARMAGVQMVHVPYKGGAPALTDLIGGQIQLLFGSMPLTLRQVKAGKVKALGVTSAARAPLLPDVPAIAEAGVPGYEISIWWGIIAPAGVPPAILTRLHKEISDISTQAEAAQRLEAEGAAPWTLSRADFDRLIANEIGKWTRIAREANIKVE